jgi:hypothetical protein
MLFYATGKGALGDTRDRAQSLLFSCSSRVLTGKPPGPSSIDGHPSLSLLIPIGLPVRNPNGLAVKDARRCARPIGLLPQGPGGD